MLIATDGDKVPFVAAANKDAMELGLNAGDVVKTFGAQVGGRGGGKPAMAQGAGSDESGIDAGLEAARTLLQNSLSGTLTEKA